MKLRCDGCRVLACLIVLVLGIPFGHAGEATYPVRPVRLIVPFVEAAAPIC